MRKLFPFMMLLLLLASFVGCSKNQPTESDGQDTEWLAQVEANGNRLDESAAVFDSLLALSDTLSAIEGTVTYLSTCSDVEWAEFNGTDGFRMEFSNGMLGGIIIRLSGTGQEGLIKTGGSAEIQGGGIPTVKRAIFIDPDYTSLGHEPIWAAMGSQLPNVDIEDIIEIPDTLVTPASLAAISNFGLVHLDGHRSCDTSPRIPDEIFYLLSVPARDIYHSNFKADMDKHTLNKVRRGDTGIVTYEVSPQFIRDHNSWTGKNTIVWNGICSGFLGTWPQTIIGTGAACYLGWDGGVDNTVEIPTAVKFYDFMCDTPATDPFSTTVGAFFADNYATLPSNPSLCMAGDPMTSLQEVVPLGWTLGDYELSFTSIQAWANENGKITLNFSNYPDMWPRGFVGIDSSGPPNFSPVWAYPVIYISPLEAYDNSNWQLKADPRPCYAKLTELDLTPPLGKVSGYIYGYVYRRSVSWPPPVPISCKFENIAIDLSITSGLTITPFKTDVKNSQSKALTFNSNK